MSIYIYIGNYLNYIGDFMERENIELDNPAAHCRYTEMTLEPGKSYRGDHFHDEVEVVYAKKSNAKCIINGEEAIVPEGSVIVIASRAVHRLTSCGAPAEVKYIQANIDSAVESLFPDYSLFACFLEKDTRNYAIFPFDGEMGNIFSSVCRELDEKSRYFDIAIKGSLYSLIAIMCRAEILNIGHKRDFDKILPAMQWARENFSHKITLDMLCEHLNTDKYNFCKRFKEISGITFFEYLAYLRLKHAEDLIAYTGKSITEIALESGFCSLQYFNRFFSEHKGYSPSAYRKMLYKD